VFKESVDPLLDTIVEGYNCTAFAYGMTGAGKTHTMFGDIYGNANNENGLCVMAVYALLVRLPPKKDKRQANSKFIREDKLH
jgi:hypothetical protein